MDTLEQEFWTYEVTNSYPFWPGKEVSIYSIPMWIRADYHDNVWVMEPAKLICTPDNEEIARHICLVHNANVFDYHKNNGNTYDIYQHFSCMVGFLASYHYHPHTYGLTEIIAVNKHTYVHTRWKHWLNIANIRAVYPKIIGSDRFITDCAYPHCFERCVSKEFCDIRRSYEV